MKGGGERVDGGKTGRKKKGRMKEKKEGRKEIREKESEENSCRKKLEK